MAQRIARAVLALLCAVAVVYGTAMFPAAFDVELRSDQPDVASGPTAPAESTAHGPGDAGSSSTTESGAGPAAESTETERSTPSSSPADGSTPTTPQSGATGGDGGDADGLLGSILASLFGLFLFASVGVAVVLSLASLTAAGGSPGSWLSATSPGSIASRAPLPSLAVRRFPQLTTLFVVTAGSGIARLAADAATVASAVASALADAVGPTAGALGRSLVAAPRALGTLLAAPVRAVGTAATLFGGLGFLRSGVSRPSFDDSEKPAADARADREPAPDADDDDAEAIESVLDAWAAMTDLVPVRNPETTTAAEYARTAVAAGLPAAPVERLTALFREVRYGGRTDSEDRVSAARRALDGLTGGEDR